MKNLIEGEQFPVGAMLSIKSEGETARGKFIGIEEVYDKKWMVLDTTTDSLYSTVGKVVLPIVKVYILVNKISAIGVCKENKIEM